MKYEEQIKNLLNEQITEEVFSFNIYYAMYCNALNMGYNGIAHFLKKSAFEELNHAKIITKYMSDRKITIDYKLKVDNDQLSNVINMEITEIFQTILEHEQYITKCLHDIYKISFDNEDYLTYNLIGDLIKEQIEEEAKAYNILDIIKNTDVEHNKSSLFLLDNYLKKQ